MRPSCASEGCERPWTKKSYCDKHYYRFKRYGDPHQVKSRYQVKSISKRETFLSKIKIEDDGCWNWTGVVNGWGYGRLAYQSTHQAAHRYAYEEFIGPIPEDKCVCHRCDNPSCVNPEHLFLGTLADNSQDMVRKGRHIGSRKLNEEKVRVIRQLIARGVKHKDIASTYGVTRSAIGNIATKTTWAHVKDE
jgi:hypothetical protein